MNRRLTILLVACAIALPLAACGDSGGIEGTWTLDKSHLQKQLYDLGMKAAGPQLEKAKQMLATVPEAQRAAVQKMMDGLLATAKEQAKEQTDKMSFEAEFKSDGTVAANMSGEKKTATWKLEGDQVTITPEGEEPRTGTFRDGKIEMTIPTPGGDLIMQLIRK